MLSGLTVLGIFCLYMGLLFMVAQWGLARAQRGRSLVNNPLVYSLSLAVYCSTWTFLGSVGLAADRGMLFAAVYLGPVLACIFLGRFMNRVLHLKERHHITSLADFISARYEKSEPLAALVTVVLLVGVIPYVALQLKAVLATFTIITGTDSTSEGFVAAHLGPIVVGMMILFTIVFGVRRLDPSERHEGMVLAVAAESLVKLVAFWAAGLFVCYGVFDGIGDIFDRLAANPAAQALAAEAQSSVSLATWAAWLLVSAHAFLFLPRQFHVAVVENTSPRHVRWAMWLFPLYLFAINLFVIPLALAGTLKGYPLAQADTFVLRLPLDFGGPGVALMVLIGSFSAGMSMILISAMTMSTMISNHLLLPLVDWIPQLGFIERRILQARWLSVAGFIVLGYLFQLIVGQELELANIGMISFVGVLQLGPALVGGMIWRRGTRKGATWGILAGFTVWFYTLLVPVLGQAGWWVQPSVLTDGPWGLEFLRPGALFGALGLDEVTHTVFWSLLFNTGFYLLGSLWSEASPENRAAAESFVGTRGEGPLFAASARRKADIPLPAKAAKIERIYQRYFDAPRAYHLVERALEAAQLDDRDQVSITELAEFFDQAERLLGGSIGAATAHRVFDRARLYTASEAEDLREVYAELLADLHARPQEIKRKIDYYQEREALMQLHADELERKVAELERENAARRRAESRLAESEERYRITFEHSSDGVAVVSGVRMIFINQRLAEIFGYDTKTELVNHPLAKIIHSDDRERVLEIARRRQAGENVPTRYDFKGIRRDGAAIFVAVSATGITYHGQRLNLVYLRDVTNRRQAEEDIRNLSRRLIAGIEEERRRLAADLHDEFGQSLTGLHLAVESLKNTPPADRAGHDAACGRLIGVIEGLADDLRAICSELRPDVLDHLGLVAAAQWYVEEYRQRVPGLEVDFAAVGFVGKKLPSESEIALYRILQEALNNVAKHAGAQRVEVRLTYSHPQVIMVIADDGRGFAMDVAPGAGSVPRQGIGLLSMRERVASAGGDLDIKSGPGKGTRIRVNLPGGETVRAA